MSQVHSLIAGKSEPIPVRMLVVEDSTTLAGALKKGLAGYGYELEVAHDGQTATRIFAEMKPELVLLDYHLPDTTGENLLQTFAAQKPRPIVVMMTADPDPDLAVKWMRQGAAAYVRKPFKVGYLATLCTTVLREQNLLSIEDLLEERTRQLRESEARFRDLAELLPEALFETDLEGNLTFANFTGFNLSGYDSEALPPGVSAFDIVIPEQRAIARSRAARLLEGEKIGRFEYTALRKDGSTFPAIVHSALIMRDGRPVGFRGVIMDITERKRMESALEEESTRRRILFEQSPDGILIIDPQTARFLEFNTAAHRQLGYSREEFAQLSIPDVEAKETAEETKACIARVIRDGKADFDTLQRTRQGEVRNVHVTAQITDIQGRPVYYCVWRDITERKQAEEEILRRHRELELVLDSVVAAIWYLDTQGRVVKWNPVAEKTSGMPSSQVRGRTIHTLAPTWDDPDRRHQESLNVALSGQPLLGSIESFCTDGEVQWVRVDKVPWRDIYGAIIGAILFIYDITDFKRMEEEREKLILELRDALGKVKTLSGLLPICASCKKIRNDRGHWEQMEVYIRDRSQAEFTHGLCPECAKQLYPDCYEEK